MYVDNEFQFHKGTIKTTEHQGEKFAKENFNSIKVRLKQNLTLKYVSIPYFNSIKVRLKLKIINNLVISKQISIP